MSAESKQFSWYYEHEMQEVNTRDSQSEVRAHSSRLPVALSIAGSDSGGGAGVQADLKVFTALGCFGTTAITCVTAQNPSEVSGVMPVSTDIISEQISAVCDGFGVAAAKTGMLFSGNIIMAVAEAISMQNIQNLVVDPVMVATSGSRLLKEEAVTAMIESILPLATVITPNLPEAEVICGRPLSSLAEVEKAAEETGRRFDTACVIKGGHSAESEDQSVDVLYHDGGIRHFSSSRISGVNTHGSGCSFSAAITAHLAHGCEIPEAVEKAKAFITGAISNPSQVGDICYLNLANPK
jgi:hydroxymethylpyrimidine/phosphomethylpyrimidine kinase